MIDAVVYGALGFFFASLLAVLFMPLLWRRAVRITTRKLEATLPMTSAEIRADKDQLRAAFALELHQLETALQKAKTKATRELIETSKGRVAIDQLTAELDELKQKLEETENQNLTLERTLHQRLPALEAQAQASDETATQMGTAKAEVEHRLERQMQALRAARETVQQQSEEIEHLRRALLADTIPIKRLFSRPEPALAADNRRLIAKISMLQEQLGRFKQQETNDYLLREEMRKLSLRILQAANPDAPVADFVGEEQPQTHEHQPARTTNGHDDTAGEPPAPAEQPAASENDEQAAPSEKAETAQAQRPTIRSRLAATTRRRSETGNAKDENGQPKRSGQSLAQRLAARAARAAQSEPAAPSHDHGEGPVSKTAEPK